MKFKWFKGLVTAMAALSLVSSAWAAPGSLSTLPLITSTQVEPNIMLILDSSGSMQNPVPDLPFDPTVTYFTCPAATTISTSSNIALYISSSSNIPYFYSSTDNRLFDWGTGSGNGSTGKSARCFNPTQTYNAALLANTTVNSNGCDLNSGNNISNLFNSLKNDRCTDTGGSNTTAYGPATFSGNYLNWYFGSTPTNWGSSAQIKPGVQSRIQIARSVMTSLVNSLTNVRVGVSQYDNANAVNGVNILVGIDDIGTTKNPIVTAIAGIGAANGTPLASSIFELGRYFVQGHNSTLTLHPGQSNQSTQAAYTALPNTPLYKSGVTQSSPIQYYCQKSFIVLTTDGLPSLPDDNTNILNSGSGLISYAGTQGDQTSQLDDMTMALFDIDLRPDLVPSTGTKSAKNNVSTYTVGFADSAVQGSSLLASAASLSGGQSFSALNTSQLTTALQQALANIAAKASTASGATFSTPSLSTGTTIYAPQYSSASWSGDLIAYPVSSTGVVGTQAWSAATLLDAVAATNRVVITYNLATNTAIPFRTLTSLPTTQQNDLKISPSGSSDSNGQLRLNFLRGDRSLEGTTFRTRGHVLGDIVNSTPIYVGAPESGWPDTAPFPTATGSKYSDFVKTSSVANRTPVVYVGANDGMLHGFNANTGQDILDFIPNNLFTTTSGLGLHYLTDPAYQHRFYVDGSPTVQDAYFSARSGATQWRTVLVGGENGGGRGYYALDVTNPSNFSEANANNIFMWEFNSGVTADLGYTYGRPIIGLMNNGQWAAIFGNGYNNTGTGSAKLFIVFLGGGIDGAWTAGTDYITIDTKVGTLSNLNGLSAPTAVDLDGNKTIDRIYAGDVQGNMWAFDLTASSPSSWKVAYGTTTTPAPLFAAGTTQPITAAPTVIQNPAVGSGTTNQPDLLVLFGTGQYLTSADQTTTSTQSFYGVWDAAKGSLTPSNLVAQTFSLTSGNRIMTNNSVGYSNTGTGKTYGWLINLTAGERVLTSAVVRSVLLQPQISTGAKETLVFFDTMIPNVSTPCAYGGSGFLMGVSATTGGQPTQPIFDVNNDNQVTTADNISSLVVSGIPFTQGVPMGSALRGDYLFTPASDSSLTATKIVSDTTLLGRISWREIMSGQN